MTTHTAEIDARTILLCGTHAEAVAWCREHGLAPYARTTVIRTTPDSVRGLVFRAGDHIVWLAAPSDAMLAAVMPASLASGVRVIPPGSGDTR